MAFDKTRYDIDYAKNNVTRVFIPFNHTKPEDAALLDFARSQGNVTAYIKALIRADMEQKTGVSLSNRLSEDNEDTQDD